MLSFLALLAQEAPTIEEIKKQLDLDSLILMETFYYWTVVVMWLIHVGFMAYEAGVARRKNLMSTAMKNILTIAVVTPTFYYFGWYIYGCFEEGWPKSGHASPDAFPGFCGLTAPWSSGLGPNMESNLTGHLSLVFFLAFLIFSWTTVDLTPLGNARYLLFDLNSSDVGQFGMNTPAYFAMDNLTWESR